MRLQFFSTIQITTMDWDSVEFDEEATKNFSTFIAGGGSLTRADHDRNKKKFQMIHHGGIKLFPRVKKENLILVFKSRRKNDTPRALIHVYGFANCMSFLDQVGKALSNVYVEAKGLSAANFAEIFDKILEIGWEHMHGILLKDANLDNIHRRSDWKFERLNHLRLINIEPAEAFAKLSFQFQEIILLEIDADQIRDDFPIEFQNLNTLKVELGKLNRRTRESLLSLMFENRNTIIDIRIYKRNFNRNDGLGKIEDFEFLIFICCNLSDFTSVTIQGFIFREEDARDAFYSEQRTLGELNISVDENYPRGTLRFAVMNE